MIRIDNISFDFSTNNESFTDHLYAQWDEFCQACFEKVVEEYLTEYDRKKILTEVDQLDIDLGKIPEEEFYRQFPIRLREALQLQLNISGIRKDQEEYSWKARLDNLFYFLENGFCYVEWADPDFNIAEELDLLMEHLPQRIPGLIQSCFSKEHMLERLMLQVSQKAFVQLIVSWNESKKTSPAEQLQVMVRLTTTRPELIAGMLVRLYGQRSMFFAMISLLESALQSDPSISSATCIQIQLRVMEHMPERLRHHLLDEWKESMLWLSSSTVSLHEKRRYLGIILDTRPDIPILFIHETEEESHLDRIAEILDSVVVRQIIITECEPHAEVDVPIYWHNLYNWMTDHYPFNGLAIFGDKQHFRKHLNRQLLTFIRKRNYAAYLSKEELTLKFLLEVFGHEYYQNVLNAIFNLQPHNTDGSLAYTGTFNRELYRMLLKLSVLRQPSLPKYARHEFTHWLMDIQINRGEKLSFLKKMVVEQPDILQEWVCSIRQNSEVITLVAELTDIRFMHELMRIVSPHTAETFRQLEENIHINTSQIAWLSGINGDKLSFFIRKSMFHWMGLYQGRFIKEEEYTEQFMQLLYLEVTGNGNGMEANTISETGKKKTEETIRKMSGRLRLADSPVNSNLESKHITKQFNTCKTGTTQNELMQNIKNNVNMKENNIDELQKEPEYISVSNAGLALLSPWFPHFFSILGLLKEDKKEFRNTDSQIRAIFLLQNLVGFDKEEFSEQELAFNRILVNCPFSEPLPRQLELEKKEKDIIREMLNGVKGNWTKLQNTSIMGFQQSFIKRNGQLEQQEEKWILSVEERAYDILLDSLPWSFRQIRNPWLKRPIYVKWRSNSNF